MKSPPTVQRTDFQFNHEQESNAAGVARLSFLPAGLPIIAFRRLPLVTSVEMSTRTPRPLRTASLHRPRIPEDPFPGDGVHLFGT